jgi:hypothetical protein
MTNDCASWNPIRRREKRRARGDKQIPFQADSSGKLCACVVAIEPDNTDARASARAGKWQYAPALHLAGYYRAVLHARIASHSGVISILGHGRGET